MPVLATFPLPLVALNLALQEPTDQWGAAYRFMPTLGCFCCASCNVRAECFHNADCL